MPSKLSAAQPEVLNIKTEPSVLTPKESHSRQWQAAAYDANGKLIAIKSLPNDEAPDNFKATLYHGEAVQIVFTLESIGGKTNGP